MQIRTGSQRSGSCLSTLMRAIFFTLLMHMLMSSWGTLTDTSKNSVLLALWASLSSVKLACKITHQEYHRYSSQLISLVQRMSEKSLVIIVVDVFFVFNRRMFFTNSLLLLGCGNTKWSAVHILE